MKYNSNNPSNPVKTSNNLDNYNDPKGQIYVILEMGGLNIHQLEGKKSFIANQ